MQQALSTVDTPIDYLNTHGTSTPVGDVAEMKGVREVFGDKARRSARPRACPATRWAPLACTRRSTAC
jgi:3-oxoacyl-[acyl-carrier-protein] synthase-1